MLVLENIMKKRINVILLLLLIVIMATTFVACDPEVEVYSAEYWGLDVNSPTTYRRPYALSNSNNPNDEKLQKKLTEEDASNALHSGTGDVCIVIELTNSESINNLFYDYTLDDFGVEYCEDPEFSAHFAIHTERDIRQDYTIGQYRNSLRAGEKIDLSRFNRKVEIDVTYSDIRNGEAIKIANDIAKIEFVRNIRLRNVGFMTTTPTGYEEDMLWASERINLREAWDYTTGSPNVTVGVIDSGVSSTHMALQHAHNSNFDHYDDFGEDNYGHGTMVAGVMFAKDSVSGVYGVCHDAKYASLKGCIGSENERIDIVTQRIIDAQRDGIQVLNFSAGFYQIPLNPNEPAPTQQEIDALYVAIENYDGLLVVAAGNEDKNLDADLNKLYPQCFNLPNILVVGASTSSDSSAAYSNKGKQTVDLFAPGDSIYTTQANGSYNRASGTSVAAPFVAGVAALLKSYDYTLTTAQIKEAILNSVTEVADLDGLCVSGGILNAQAALEYVCNHDFEATYIDENTHYEECGMCGFRETVEGIKPHSLAYIHNNALSHRYACKCGYISISSEEHRFKFAGLLGGKQRVECINCGFTKLVDLDVPIVSPNDLLEPKEQTDERYYITASKK